MNEVRRKELLMEYKNRKPQMGIIYFKSIVTDEWFLDVSKDTKADINGNLARLNGGMHPNLKLQKLWNKYYLEEIKNSFKIKVSKV